MDALLIAILILLAIGLMAGAMLLAFGRWLDRRDDQRDELDAEYAAQYDALARERAGDDAALLADAIRKADAADRALNAQLAAVRHGPAYRKDGVEL